MPPWTPSFGMFHSWLDQESLTTITVDQAATAGIGRDHPVSVVVLFELRAPDQGGLVSAEERPAIFALEDAIERELAECGEPWLVGWRTERGSRYLFFYLPGDAEDVRLPRDWVGGYETRYAATDDPDWKHYRENLAPTPFQELLIAGHAQVQALSKLGDDPRAERTVDHTVHFPDAASASAGADALRRAGFTVVEAAGPRVSCTRVHDLEIRTLESVMSDALDAAERHGGTYDGWGAAVATGSGAPAKRRRLFRR